MNDLSVARVDVSSRTKENRAKKCILYKRTQTEIETGRVKGIEIHNVSSESLLLSCMRPPWELFVNAC